MTHIAVLGSANMDLVVRQERAVRPGETIAGRDFSTGAGGKGLNQAVAAARAGADVRFVGAVGDDDFGRRLRDVLQDDAIDVDRLRTVDAPTGIAAITVTDDGENSIVVVAGANGDAVLADADRAVIASASHLVVQLERPIELVVEALAYARTCDVVTVLTPAPVVPGAERLVGLADILIPNQHEAAALTGLADPREAGAALSADGAIVVVTLGADGVIVARGGAIVIERPARRVTPVDTTGAGDTFVGVLIARLAEGSSLTDALDTAIVAAAISVTRVGAAASMPTRDEIAAHLDPAAHDAAASEGESR